MLYTWRVIKKSTHNDYSYVSLSFNMLTGDITSERINDRQTTVRLKKTTEFEILENDEWMTLPYKDVKGLMQEFNHIRKLHGYDELDEEDILIRLYKLEELR